MKRFLLVVFIFVSWFSQGQNANYTPLGGPYGGAIMEYVSVPGAIVGYVNNTGIVRSTDSGQSWTVSNTGLLDNNLFDIEYDAVAQKLYALSYNRLYSSIDGGLNWVTVASSGFTQPYKMVKAPNGNLYIIQNGASPKKVYKSTNSGVTWAQSGSISTTGYLRDFKVGANSYLYLAIDGDGLYRSTNNGLSFIKSSAITDQYVRSITVSSTDVYVLTSTGPFRSTDSGTTWSSVKGNITDTCFDGIIASGSGSVFIFNSCVGKVYSTADSGTSWNLALTYPNAAFNGVYLGGVQSGMVNSANEIYTSLYSGSFVSFDGGVNWTDGSLGVTGLYGNDLHLTPNSNLLYASGNYQSGFHFSNDDGTTWTYKYTAGASSTVYGFFNGSGSTAGSVFAYGTNISKSTDDGATWSTVSTGITYFPKVVSVDGSTFYATDGGTTLRKSVNAGVNWTNQTITGFPSPSYVINKSMFLDGTGKLIFGVYNQGINKNEIYKVDPATLVATQITAPGTINSSIDVYNGKIYAGVGNTDLAISSDGGATWTTKASPASYATIKVIDDNTIFLLADNTYLSTDGGNSWVNTGTFGTGTYATDALLSASNYSYIAVNNSVIQKSVKPVVPPLAPSGLSVTGYNHSRIGLTWTDNSSNEDYFIIEQSVGDNTKYDSIAYLTANAFINSSEFVTITGRANQTTYYYRIRAASAAGKSAYTNEVSATTLANCTATSAIPTNRSWTGTTLNESGVGIKTNALVSITAQGSPGFYILDNLNVGAAAAAPISHPEPTVATFSENCGSVFMISAGNDRTNGNGTWDANTKTLTIHWQTRPQLSVQRAETTVFTLNPTFPTPTAATSPTAYVNTATSVYLSWTSGKYVEEYIVKRSLTTGSGFAEVGRVQYPTTNFIDLNLTTGTKYYYTITSSNSTGTSAPSSETSITVNTPLFASVEIAPADILTGTPYGTTWTDLDGDNLEDLILSFFNAPDTPIKVFRNKGDGTFDLAYFAGLTDDLTSSHSGGLVAADYNNDGKIDLLMAAVNPYVNKLWTNKGGGVFESTDIFAPAGSTNTPSFADFNNDGLLDISFSDFISNGTTPKPFYIFQQNADHTFSRYDAGVIGSDLSISISSSWADYDNDNDLDLYVEEYGDPSKASKLYRNEGKDANNNFLGFSAQTVAAFDTDAPIYSESSSWGDFDNDGDLDLFQGNTSPNSPSTLNDMLYQNNGDGTFTRLTASLPSEILANGVYTNGSSWGDVDNDGDLDLFVARYPQSTLYLNTNGTSTFTKYSGVEYLNSGNAYDNSIAFADYNKDGFLDAFVQRSKLQPLTVSKNAKTASASAKWIELKLIGTSSNKTAIGARVTLNLPSSKKQIREVAGNTGFTTQNSTIVHFGLGSNSTIPSLVVRWPSGITQTLTNVAANQILTITEDNTGPAVVTYNPVQGGTGVATTTKLEVTLDEASTAVSGKNISLYITSNATTPVFTAAVTSATKTGNTYSFTLPSKLQLSATYYATLDAGAFVDIYNNASLAIAANAWTFTTTAGPQIVTFAPANNATGVNANTTFAVTFGTSVTPVSGKNFYLLSSADLATPLATIDVTSATQSGNQFTFILPQKLNRQKSYNITFDAAAFTDASGNDFSGLSPANWKITSDAGPDVSSVTPANAAVNVAADASIELTFTRPITAVSGKKIKVVEGTNTLIDADVSATGTVAGSKYTLPAPSSKWPYLKVISVSIDEGAFVDANLNDQKAVAPGQYSFTIVEQPDLTPPVITFDGGNFSLLEKGFSAQTFAAGATDDKGVTSASIYHRKISEKTYTKSDLVKNGSGNWEATVTSSYADDMGFEYYFVARDAAGHKGRLPLDSARFVSRVKLTGANKPQLDLPGGASQNSWKVISIPYDLSSSQIETIFTSALGGKVDKSVWKLLRYTVNPAPTGAWIEYPSAGFANVDRGAGYFINTKNPVKITLTDPNAPNYSRDNLFKMSLVKGWNQIGNPYTTNILWSEAIAYNNASGTVQGLKMFTGGSYVASDELSLFQGGFVFATADVSDFRIPFKGQTLTGGRVAQETPSKELNQDNWQLPLTLKQGDVVNQLGAIGMNPESLVSFDKHDEVTPPRFFDYVELSFDHPEHFAKKFSHDIVPTQADYTWEFTVNSNLEGQATLQWDNLEMGNNAYDLFLMDVQNQMLLNMRETTRFAFDPRESNKFKIFFGTNLKSKIVPSKVVLGKAFPNPTTGVTSIPFSLPDQSGSYQVNLEVYDMMGKKINTIINGTFNPGFYNSEWDTSLSSLVNGVYIYRLAVSSGNVNEVQSGKIIIKK